MFIVINMKWINTIIGIGIILISSYVGYAFHNPFPCTTSCCGCSSTYEMLQDTWAQYFLIVGLIIGMVFLVRGIFDEGKKYDEGKH